MMINVIWMMTYLVKVLFPNPVKRKEIVLIVRTRATWSQNVKNQELRSLNVIRVSMPNAQVDFLWTFRELKINQVKQTI